MNSIQSAYKSIIENLDLTHFHVPNDQADSSYFPDYLKELLSNYIGYYEKHLVEKIDITYASLFNSPEFNALGVIKDFSDIINKTIEYYFQGRVSDASSYFFKALDLILLENQDKDSKLFTTINQGRTFYRARKNEGNAFLREELFHIKFDLRHTVSTNRYSIPGFPALYLGGSTYVCWEEFNQHRFRDLFFVRVKNEVDLNVFSIQRLEDFIEENTALTDELTQHKNLIRYLITFPLTLACTVKVKEVNGSFKPEYIIPQLLSEYVSRKSNIDGIKFLSTKVDYSKIKKIDAYNYVFPVKKIEKENYCPILSKSFELSEPTSIELEEIRYNPISEPNQLNGGMPNDGKSIEIVKGVESEYVNTSFGRIENILESRKIERIENS